MFWFMIWVALMMFIFFNGEEFVNKPRLKMEWRQWPFPSEFTFPYICPISVLQIARTNYNVGKEVCMLFNVFFIEFSLLYCNEANSQNRCDHAMQVVSNMLSTKSFYIVACHINCQLQKFCNLLFEYCSRMHHFQCPQHNCFYGLFGVFCWQKIVIQWG